MSTSSTTVAPGPLTHIALISHLPRWVNVCLVAIIGFALALLTIESLPKVADRSAAVNHPMTASTQAADPINQGKSIINEHLFGSVDAQPIDGDPPPPPQPPSADLNLNGVFAYTPQSMAIAIISEKSGEHSAYWIGDKVIGETTLKEVHPTHVILNNRGTDEILTLSDEAVPTHSPIERGSPSIEQQALTVPSNPNELRSWAIKNVEKIPSLLSTEPYQENGKLLGYRITPKQNPEILEAQGIYAGDVIVRMNNIELSSQKQAVRALRNAARADSLNITLLRDGVEIPVSILFNQ